MQEGTVIFSMDLGPGECFGHVVVALRGELDLTEAAGVAAALEIVATGGPRIIVDLAGLEFIDASGVAALGHGRRLARSARGDLLLATPKPRVARVLAIIWKTGGSGIHASVAEAVASARASSQVVVPIQRQHAGTTLPTPVAGGISG